MDENGFMSLLFRVEVVERVERLDPDFSEGIHLWSG